MGYYLRDVMKGMNISTGSIYERSKDVKPPFGFGKVPAIKMQRSELINLLEDYKHIMDTREVVTVPDALKRWPSILPSQVLKAMQLEDVTVCMIDQSVQKRTIDFSNIGVYIEYNSRMMRYILKLNYKVFENSDDSLMLKVKAEIDKTDLIDKKKIAMNEIEQAQLLDILAETEFFKEISFMPLYIREYTATGKIKAGVPICGRVILDNEEAMAKLKPWLENGYIIREEHLYIMIDDKPDKVPYLYRVDVDGKSIAKSKRNAKAEKNEEA